MHGTINPKRLFVLIASMTKKPSFILLTTSYTILFKETAAMLGQ